MALCVPLSVQPVLVERHTCTTHAVAMAGPHNLHVFTAGVRAHAYAVRPSTWGHPRLLPSPTASNYRFVLPTASYRPLTCPCTASLSISAWDRLLMSCRGRGHSGTRSGARNDKVRGPGEGRI